MAAKIASDNAAAANLASDNAAAKAAAAKIASDNAAAAKIASDNAAAKAAAAKIASDNAMAESTACLRKLNTFIIDGQKVICPTGFTLGNGWVFGQEDKKNCVMTEQGKSNCGWGSCDPSQYGVGNFGAWPNSRIGDPRGKPISDEGYYFSTTYSPDKVYYMTTPLPYDDKYCIR